MALDKGVKNLIGRSAPVDKFIDTGVRTDAAFFNRTEGLMYESADTGALMAFQFVVFLALYLYIAACQYVIAKKVGHDYSWWAFVPILNIFQWVQMAGKQWYWFLFMLIPVVNLVTFAMLWVEIAKARGKAPFWGVLMLLPFVNYIVIAVLAAGGTAGVGIRTYQETPASRQPADVK